jgi:ATP-dependent RNA helicase RhlE
LALIQYHKSFFSNNRLLNFLDVKHIKSRIFEQLDYLCGLLNIRKYMTFKDLGIIAPILKALEAKGYTHPTPIQEESIPILLQRKDLLGCAQTGTGKTAAFAIPIIQHLHLNSRPDKGKRKIKALVVTPTRELAIQIADSFTLYGKYTGIKNTVIFGGVKQGAQTSALNRGVDVLVATPGRLLDLINQGYITLKNIEYFVLDEADQMLDMGFIHDIKKVIALLPTKRQSLFFSATMPKTIVELSGKILGNPEKVTIKPEQATAEKVEQSVYFVSKKNKPKLLVHLLKEKSYDSVLVFSRTKHGADKIAKVLDKASINAGAIHGNKSQNARQRALNDFKDKKLKVLVATDIAARGIDVSQLSLVINYDLPNIPETYVHRIGRTGRASASGFALSFCNGEERPYLRDIQKLIDQKIPVIDNQPYPDDGTEDAVAPKSKAKPQRSNRPKSGVKNSAGNESKTRPRRPRTYKTN